MASTLPRPPNARSPSEPSAREQPADLRPPIATLACIATPYNAQRPARVSAAGTGAPPNYRPFNPRAHRWPQTRQLLLLSTSELNMAMDYPCL